MKKLSADTFWSAGVWAVEHAPPIAPILAAIMRTKTVLRMLGLATSAMDSHGRMRNRADAAGCAPFPSAFEIVDCVAFGLTQYQTRHLAVGVQKNSAAAPVDSNFVSVCGMRGRAFK